MTPLSPTISPHRSRWTLSAKASFRTNRGAIDSQGDLPLGGETEEQAAAEHQTSH